MIETPIGQTGKDRAELLESLYESYYKRVAATVRKFRLSSQLSDDIIQDTFIKAWQNLENLRDENALGGWLITSARNRCISEIRKEKKTIAVTSADSNSDQENFGDVIIVAEDHHASFHFEHSIQLLGELIALHQGEPRATVAKLFYLEKLTIKQISQQLEMKSNTVLAHLRRFRLIVSKSLLRIIEEANIQLQ